MVQLYSSHLSVWLWLPPPLHAFQMPGVYMAVQPWLELYNEAWQGLFWYSLAA